MPMWLCWKSSKPQKHRKPAPFGAGFLLSQLKRALMVLQFYCFTKSNYLMVTVASPVTAAILSVYST